MVQDPHHFIDRRNSHMHRRFPTLPLPCRDGGNNGKTLRPFACIRFFSRHKHIPARSRRVCFQQACLFHQHKGRPPCSHKWAWAGKSSSCGLPLLESRRGRPPARPTPSSRCPWRSQHVAIGWSRLHGPLFRCTASVHLRFESPEITLPSDHWDRGSGSICHNTSFRTRRMSLSHPGIDGVRTVSPSLGPGTRDSKRRGVSNRTVHSSIDGPGCELARALALGMRCTETVDACTRMQAHRRRSMWIRRRAKRHP